MKIILRFTLAAFAQHAKLLGSLVNGVGEKPTLPGETYKVTYLLEMGDMSEAIGNLIILAKIRGHIHKMEGFDRLREQLRELLDRLDQLE